MAGRGPSPKLGEVLGHRSKAEQARRRSAAPSARAKRRRPPAGTWHPQAERWWKSAMLSHAVDAWDEQAWAQAERCMAMVDSVWRLRDAGEHEKFLAGVDRVRRQEQALYLPPVERLRAVKDGVLEPRQPPEPAATASSSGSSSRSRLRAVGD